MEENKASTDVPSFETIDSDIKINEQETETWARVADQLPEEINIRGETIKSSDLSGRARKLLVIYLTDIRLIGQQKELLALAELGLKTIEKEIISIATK